MSFFKNHYSSIYRTVVCLSQIHILTYCFINVARLVISEPQIYSFLSVLPDIITSSLSGDTYMVYNS